METVSDYIINELSKSKVEYEEVAKTTCDLLYKTRGNGLTTHSNKKANIVNVNRNATIKVENVLK